MSDDDLQASDYPIAEKRPERVAGARGKRLEDITVDTVVSGNVTMDDLRITPAALLDQARIARSVGRAALAANFERAAEMTRIPQEDVMRVYELLRPGRAGSKQVLLDAATDLRARFDADQLARFVEEAAAVYEKRGLYRNRF
ncbi:glycerol dehydratase [Rhodospirillaceae bacterium KN72]|uniref:Glycerol dehydratase n=1 Tax=Pacificispira spongiicola TaxID=2729598 RepID=A0A7Y0DXY6_9PROT|nr:diol dehydratase small subunit [Pacificispira spongiicola]NMM43631.1 glycerol dehydratase [Pacificispira spongiicola]